MPMDDNGATSASSGNRSPISGAHALTLRSNTRGKALRRQADRQAARGQHDHRRNHRQFRFAGMIRMSRSGSSQEDRREHFHETGDGESADQCQYRCGKGGGTVNRLYGFSNRGKESQVEKELTDKSIERRQSTNGHGADEKQPGRPRHPLGESTQVVDLTGMRGMDDRTCAKKQQRLEQGMIPNVEQRAAQPQHDPIVAV